MKVKELIEQLSKMDPELEVRFPSSYDNEAWPAIATVETIHLDSILDKTGKTYNFYHFPENDGSLCPARNCSCLEACIIDFDYRYV